MSASPATTDGRQHTPEQLAAMRRASFQVEMSSLKDRTTITRKVEDAVLAEVLDAVGKTVGAQLSVRADKHATQILAAIQSVALGIDGFTARGKNFDVLNSTDMTNEVLAGKINQAVNDLDIAAEQVTSFGETQSELVEKANYGEHIQGLRPGAGQEILGRIERARDRAREIVAQEIRSASDRGVQPGARKGTRRAAAARLDDVKLSPDRDGAGRDQGRGLAPGTSSQNGGRQYQALPGYPHGAIKGASGPDPQVVKIAEAYARSAGIKLVRQSRYVEVDEALARRSSLPALSSRRT